MSRRQRLGTFLSSKTSDQHWDPPSLLFNGYRELRWRLSGRDVRLTTHLHPVHGVHRVNYNFYNTTAIQTVNATPPSDAVKALRPKRVNYGVGQPRRPATNAKPFGKYLAKTNTWHKPASFPQKQYTSFTNASVFHVGLISHGTVSEHLGPTNPCHSNI